jgi:hypothetical protein
MGVVLSPGGWAQGMRVSVDYSDIRVRDGINLPFNSNMPVDLCFTQSGGKQPTYDADGVLIDPGNNDAFDPNNQYCKQLRFAEQLDANGNAIPGSRDLTDLVAYTSATYQNSLPYQNRSVDVAWNYNFPLSRAFESLPGSMSLTLRGTRLLEASGIQQLAGFGSPLNTQPCGRKLELADPQNYNLDGTPRRDLTTGAQTVINQYNCINLVGQIRSSQYIPGVTAAPKWRGNFNMSYLYGSLTATLGAQYTGGAKIDLQWVDDPEDPRYYTADGQLTNATVDNNRAKPYVNLSLNAQYNLKVANMQQFQIFGSIQNLMDKDPPFVAGGLGGANASYADTFGRAYRMGVRLRF